MASSKPTSDSGESHRVIRQIHVCYNDIGNLFDNDVFSDLVLVVNDKRYKVHKNIMVARSGYFRSLLLDDAKEPSKPELSINEPNTELFEKLLRYIYLGEMHIREPFVDEATEMLLMAKKYSIPDLQKSLVDELKSALSPSNFSTVYSAAWLCSSMQLIHKCLEMADGKPIEIVQADGFSKLSVGAVRGLISRDSFKTCQVEVFTAVSKWIEANGKLNANILLSTIRIEQMPIAFLKTTVRQSRLFSDSRILDAICSIDKTDASTQTGGGEVWVEYIRTVGKHTHGPYMLVGVCAFHTIGQIKQILRQGNPDLYKRMEALRYFGTPLEDDNRTLGSYGIMQDNNGRILLTMEMRRD